MVKEVPGDVEADPLAWVGRHRWGGGRDEGPSLVTLSNHPRSQHSCPCGQQEKVQLIQGSRGHLNTDVLFWKRKASGSLDLYQRFGVDEWVRHCSYRPLLFPVFTQLYGPLLSCSLKICLLPFLFSPLLKATHTPLVLLRDWESPLSSPWHCPPFFSLASLSSVFPVPRGPCLGPAPCQRWEPALHYLLTSS